MPILAVGHRGTIDPRDGVQGVRSSNLRVPTIINQTNQIIYRVNGRGRLGRFRAFDTLVTPWGSAGRAKADP